MRFQCVDVACGKKFGWTAKKIVQTTTLEENAEFPTVTTYEHIVCPYCGSLDFEELPPPRRNLHGTPTVQTENHTKSLPIPNMEQETDQFDPADLMQHQWKGKKLGPKQWETGSLNLGWDFKDQFKPETLRALAQSGGVLKIDRYEFKLINKIVSVREAKK